MALVVSAAKLNRPLVDGIDCPHVQPIEHKHHVGGTVVGVNAAFQFNDRYHFRYLTTFSLFADK